MRTRERRKKATTKTQDRGSLAQKSADSVSGADAAGFRLKGVRTVAPVPGKVFKRSFLMRGDEMHLGAVRCALSESNYDRA